MLAPSTPIPIVEPPQARREANAGLLWAERFTQRLVEEQRVSASTLEAYTLDMTMVSRWAAGQERDLLWLTAADLARYVTDRLEQGTQRSTVARHISSCRRFYAFLLQEGIIATNPAAAVAAPPVLRPAPALVTNDALRVLLRPPVRQFPTPMAEYRGRRDHALVCTLYGTSLGISNVRLLRWPQIDELREVIRLPLPKGKVRNFALDTRLLPVLKSLRRCVATIEVDPAQDSYCFPTSSGLPMTRQAMSRVVRKWAQDCGRSELVTPSALRQAGRAHVANRRALRPAGLALRTQP